MMIKPWQALLLLCGWAAIAGWLYLDGHLQGHREGTINGWNWAVQNCRANMAVNCKTTDETMAEKRGKRP